MSLLAFAFPALSGAGSEPWIGVAGCAAMAAWLGLMASAMLQLQFGQVRSLSIDRHGLSVEPYRGPSRVVPWNRLAGIETWFLRATVVRFHVGPDMGEDIYSVTTRDDERMVLKFLKQAAAYRWAAGKVVLREGSPVTMRSLLRHLVPYAVSGGVITAFAWYRAGVASAIVAGLSGGASVAICMSLWIAFPGQRKWTPRRFRPWQDALRESQGVAR